MTLNFPIIFFLLLVKGNLSRFDGVVKSAQTFFHLKVRKRQKNFLRAAYVYTICARTRSFYLYYRYINS